VCDIRGYFRSKGERRLMKLVRPERRSVGRGLLLFWDSVWSRLSVGMSCLWLGVIPRLGVVWFVGWSRSFVPPIID
jgi:hypothetical protein